MKKFKKCKNCDMLLSNDTEYHPYAACVMYRQTGQSEKVGNWLEQIVRYGMMAQEQGVSLGDALRDITKV